MDLFHRASEFITLLTRVTLRLFCAPVCGSFNATAEAIRNPQSFLGDDADKLKQLLNDIMDMKSSKVIKEWFDEAKEAMQKIDQLWQRETSESSSNHNDDRQSSCLSLSCADACSQGNLHRIMNEIIARGEMIRRRAVERIYVVPSIEYGTTAYRNLKRVMDMLNDDDDWCIGLWGPEGVGKSFLVKELHIKLYRHFDLVRFITLTGSNEPSNVQEAIAKCLELNMGEGIEDRIHNILRNKKFLLILDDVSKSIDLQSIGIPRGQAGSKIILTTRSQNVCAEMGAKETKMGCLTKEEAWQLFEEKAGEVVNNESIKPLARKVCEECGCLPLALVVVGSAMRGVMDIDRWKDAVDSLQTAPLNDYVNSTFDHSLMVSYYLLNDTLKDCLLYCSLYPKGYPIDKNELVGCWIAEKLIDEQPDYKAAYTKGLNLIERLMESGILEQGMDGEDWEPETVKMRDKACDFARSIGKSNKKITVSHDATLPEEAKSFPWISFVDNGKPKLLEYGEDNCSATTLLLHETSNEENMEVSTNFLKCFGAVKVLSMKQVQSFASSHLQLEELEALFLMDCSNIEELPTAGNLKILHLSNNIYLRNTPRGTKKLSNVKVLNLSCTPYLKRIDADTIRSFKFLEVLNMCESGYIWPLRSISEGATLDDLSKLQRLREVYLELAEADGTYDECSWLEKLECFYFSYDRPASSRYRRKTLNINMRSLDTEVGSFILHANELILRHAENVNKIFANFSSVDQPKSKLESLEIGKSAFGPSLAATVSERDVLLKVEKLRLERNRLVSSWSDITNALEANFSNLRSLDMREPSLVFFTTDDQHIKLPQLESLSVHDCQEEVAFDCSLADMTELVPKLRTLEFYNSDRLKKVCNYGPNEQWVSLQVLKVKNCRWLKELPLMPSIREIRGSEAWWKRVEWYSEEMNGLFKPF